MCKKTTNRKSVRWGMLLSHHPPAQYERTLSVGKLRLCVRCMGIFLGITVGLIFLILGTDYPSWLFLAAFVLPIPAVVNFSMHELGYWGNHNLWRWCTGVLLGLGISMSIVAIWQSHFLIGLGSLAWLVALEFAVVILLKGAGKLDAFIQTYEEGVYSSQFTKYK